MARKHTPQPVRSKWSALDSAQITTGRKTTKRVEEDLGVFADREEFDGAEYQHAVKLGSAGEP